MPVTVNASGRGFGRLVVSVEYDHQRVRFRDASTLDSRLNVTATESVLGVVNLTVVCNASSSSCAAITDLATLSVIRFNVIRTGRGFVSGTVHTCVDVMGSSYGAPTPRRVVAGDGFFLVESNTRNRRSNHQRCDHGHVVTA